MDDFAIRSIRDNDFYIYLSIFDLLLAMIGLNAFILIGITAFYQYREIDSEL